MAIFWRDQSAHRWHWFILIYFFGTSMRHVPKIRLPFVVNNMQGYGLIAMAYLKYLHLETGLTGDCRTNAFPDRLTVYLSPSVIIPCLSWLFSFWFSHFVGIPIFGNTLWYVLTLPLRSNCWGYKGILDLTEQTWIFHTNYFKQVNGIWNPCKIE